MDIKYTLINSLMESCRWSTMLLQLDAQWNSDWHKIPIFLLWCQCIRDKHALSWLQFYYYKPKTIKQDSSHRIQPRYNSNRHQNFAGLSLVLWPTILYYDPTIRHQLWIQWKYLEYWFCNWDFLMLQSTVSLLSLFFIYILFIMNVLSFAENLWTLLALLQCVLVYQKYFIWKDFFRQQRIFSCQVSDHQDNGSESRLTLVTIATFQEHINFNLDLVPMLRGQ